MLSLPAMELARCKLPASFFDLATLDNAPISAELRLALRLVAGQAERNQVRIRIVARPEIFTHGATLAWLERETAGAEDHLCISDGSTVRVLPGLRTHVFFYRAGTRDGAAALRRLARRAPELLANIVSQVNTGFAFSGPCRGSAAGVRPAVVIAQPESCEPVGEQGFVSLHAEARSIEDCTARLQNSQPLAEEIFENVDSMTYVAISGNGWENRAIAAEISRLLLSGYFNPRVGIVVLLPPAALGADPGLALATRMSAFLDALRRANIPLPRVVPRNIALATAPLPAAWLDGRKAPTEMIIDVAFEAWQQPVAYYQGFERISLVIERKQRLAWRAARGLMSRMIGREPEIRPVRALAEDGV
jgi:hypothetical protein